MNTIKKILAAIGKFLKFTYALQIVVGVVGVIEILAGHLFIGLFLITFGVISAIHEFAENKLKS
jgi:hypothetical protein